MEIKEKNIKNSLLTWKSNLLIFFFLFILLVLYFSHQIIRAKDVFIQNAKENAKMVAELINISANNSLHSLKVIDEILRIYLLNSAKFIEYLDSVEPFNNSELQAFALESGLSSAIILRDDNTLISGYSQIELSNLNLCNENSGLFYSEETEEILLTNKLGKKGCIVLGLHSDEILKLKNNIDLDSTIDKIRGLSGISFIKIMEISKRSDNEINKENTSPVIFKEKNNDYFAEIKIDFNNKFLIIGIDASPLKKNINMLWRDLIFFSIVIVFTGLVLSWFIWRLHSSHIKNVEDYERKLSQKREEELIGRAASAIAHEVRNPLNAISIGLQRLKMENTNLNREYQELIDVMFDSLRRANNIISNLQKYARIPQPRIIETNLLELVEKNLILYKKILQEKGIELQISIPNDKKIKCDTDLISQVFQNLIRNAIEAQPNGGFLNIHLGASKVHTIINFENTGEIPKEEERQHLLEPYFTTKTRGIGLGLAISKRILNAHKGDIEITYPQTDFIRISLKLPEDNGV